MLKSFKVEEHSRHRYSSEKCIKNKPVGTKESSGGRLEGCPVETESNK